HFGELTKLCVRGERRSCPPRSSYGQSASGEPCMHRRLFLSVMASGLAAAAFPGLAQAAKQNRRPYQGAELVYMDTYEQPGTVIVDTRDRVLYYTLEGGEDIRYGVAVGKEGFSGAGIAQVGRKTEWPRWTPPAS